MRFYSVSGGLGLSGIKVEILSHMLCEILNNCENVARENINE